MTNLALSPTGKRVAVEARGEVFTIPAEKGDIRNLTHSSDSAERDPAWSPDGKYVSYFSDKSGEYKLVLESQDGISPVREIALPNPTHYYTPSWSPDSKKLLYTDTNLHVWVLDVASGQTKVVGNDPWMVPERTLNPVWSPDSKWVAYSSRLRSLYHVIFIANAETGEAKQVTDGLSDAVWPAWDCGRQVSVVPRVDRFRLAVAVARHDVVRPHGELRSVPRRVEEGRGVAVPAGERRRPGRRHGHASRWARWLLDRLRAELGRRRALTTRRADRTRLRPARLARRSRCKSISTACRSAFSRSPACRPVSTRGCARARPVSCSISKRAEAEDEAAPLAAAAR